MNRGEKLRQGIFELAGEEFDIDSPIQLSYILYKKLGLPEGDTNNDALWRLLDKHPIIGLILEYRLMNGTCGGDEND